MWFRFLDYILPLIPRNLLVLGDGIKWPTWAVFLGLGILYDFLRIRQVAIGESLRRMNAHIEARMRATLAPLILQADLARAPTGDERWLRLLFKQTGEDKNLQEIANRIRGNGLLWSSIGDAGVILIAGGLGFGIPYGIAFDHPVIVYEYLLASIGVLGLLLLPLVERRHLEFVDRQQDHIAMYRRNQLHTDFLSTFCDVD
jgi:hypothetical protein